MLQYIKQVRLGCINMKSSKLYNKNIDLIRFIALCAILLYHFHLLKGGYLAVCTFFVLSGYLSWHSAFRKEKFSFRDYYWNRLIKLYLPLVIVVLLTISFFSFIPDMVWLNLKPETTSILLGYNNFWQLHANLDYFARHINSPFLHLWYISILLQFDFIFPFLYWILRKMGDKIHKCIPCVIGILLSIAGTIYFYKISFSQNVMTVYYDTFTRIFSLFFGLTLGIFHSYYGNLIPKCFQKGLAPKIFFYGYLFLLFGFFVVINTDSPYFTSSFLIVTLITCRLLDYGTIFTIKKESWYEKLIHFFVEMSYEIYLVQYPIIFLLQSVEFSNFIKILMMAGLIIMISYILHNLLPSGRSDNKKEWIKWGLEGIIFGISLYGAYIYYFAKDYTKEMQQLEKQLSKNEQLMRTKQEEYQEQLMQEERTWNSILNDLDGDENRLGETIHNFSIVGIGDSVMLGAVENLYTEFPNGYFDARVSRTAWVANEIVQDLKNKNMLGEVVIFNLGANGDCSENCKREILQKCAGSEVFWLNVTNDNDVHINEKLWYLESQYENLHIIDWSAISKGHPEYFVADGIHLTEIGKKAYTQAIYDSIYQFYFEKYQKKKEEIIQKHEEEQKSKISFYGNDILLNVFDYLQSDFANQKFTIYKDFNYGVFQTEIKNAIDNRSLSYKVVLMFDGQISLNDEEYQSLIELCEGHHIYILFTNSMTPYFKNLENENVTVIDFSQEIKKHDDFVMADKIHLTEKGNQALRHILKEVLK